MENNNFWPGSTNFETKYNGMGSLFALSLIIIIFLFNYFLLFDSINRI